MKPAWPRSKPAHKASVIERGMCTDRPTLEAVATLMGRELGWTEGRRRTEIEQVLRVYAPLSVACAAPGEATRHAER